MIPAHPDSAGAPGISGPQFSRPEISRRAFLARTALTAAAVSVLPSLASAATTQPATTTTPTSRASSSARYPIAASDWMLLKRQKPGALPLAKDCGLDGIEVDMGPLGKRPDFENNLRDETFRSDYLAQAKSLGLEIASLAMSAFYGQTLTKHEKAEQFCREWISLMPQLGTTHGFLPIIFDKQDSPEAATEKVVALMKKIAPAAEAAKVILGLNTPLDAAANIKMLDAIGSKNIRIAYNCGEAIDAKRDVYAELSALGGQRLAQIIPTLSDGVLLEHDPRLDVPKLKKVLDDANYTGWLILQRSRDAKKARDVRYNFSANAKYLRAIFQA
jgi:sugar phosphate isomerase/epimerase